MFIVNFLGSSGTRS